MKLQKKRSLPNRTLLLLALLMSGCACKLPNSAPPPIERPEPPLSNQARQPAIPLECLPPCSAALTRERESWLPTLTLPE